MNRRVFFDAVRGPLFGGRLRQWQVDGLTVILDAWEAAGHTDPRWLAYILATVHHETGPRSREGHFQPIQEAYWLSDAWRRRNLRYYPWHGRGYVQLTWRENYQRAESKLGISFTDDPTLAMVPEHAAKILITGMVEGWFTSHKLSDHFTTSKTDWRNARRIVNGTDKMALIARYAQSYHKAVLAAQRAKSDPIDVPAVDPADPTPPQQQGTSAPLIAALIVAILTAVAAFAAGQNIDLSHIMEAIDQWQVEQS